MTIFLFFQDFYMLSGSRDSDWLRAGRPRGWSSSPGRVKNFLFSMSSKPVLGSTQPPIQWIPRAVSPGVKRPGREADHSPPTSADVKKMWIFTSTPPYAFMAWCLISLHVLKWSHLFDERRGLSPTGHSPSIVEPSADLLTTKWLLVLASTAIVGSESHATQNHILLSDGSG
jgi:hypothetical protein